MFRKNEKNSMSDHYGERIQELRKIKAKSVSDRAKIRYEIEMYSNFIHDEQQKANRRIFKRIRVAFFSCAGLFTVVVSPYNALYPFMLMALSVFVYEVILMDERVWEHENCCRSLRNHLALSNDLFGEVETLTDEEIERLKKGK